MQLHNNDAIRNCETSAALTRAVMAACVTSTMTDEQRDTVVRALEDAIEAASTKSFATPSDARLIEELEGLILKLRVRGASHAAPASQKSPVRR